MGNGESLWADVTERESVVDARELLALAEVARSVQGTWWLWDEPAPEPDGYGPMLAFARAATPERVAALCNLLVAREDARIHTATCR